MKKYICRRKMPEKDKIKSNDPMGDKFIEMMEAQGVTFIDVSISKSKPDTNASCERQKLKKRLGRSIVTKKNYLKDKNKEIKS